MKIFNFTLALALFAITQNNNAMQKKTITITNQLQEAVTLDVSSKSPRYSGLECGGEYPVEPGKKQQFSEKYWYEEICVTVSGDEKTKKNPLKISMNGENYILCRDSKTGLVTVTKQ